MSVDRLSPGKTHPQPHWHDLVTLHYDLVMPIVGHLTRNAPSHVDREELHAAGLLGLVDAAKRFTPHGATPFFAYASVRIRGAIIDDMRRNDWAPRSVRAQIRQVRSATDQLLTSLQRTPTTGEIAESLGWGLTPTTQLLADEWRTQLVSLAANDHGMYDSAKAPWQSPTHDPAEQAVLQEQHTDIAFAFHCLPNDLRHILALRLIHNWSLSAIGNPLNVTDARVSQLVNEGLNVLRAVLQEIRDDVPAVAAKTPGSLRRARAMATAHTLRFNATAEDTVTHGAPNGSRLESVAPPAQRASQPTAAPSAAVSHAHTKFTPFKRSS